MNTILKRLTILETLTMTGDTLKDYVNDATSFLEEFYDVLHVCGFELRKTALRRTLGL